MESGHVHVFLVILINLRVDNCPSPLTLQMSGYLDWVELLLLYCPCIFFWMILASWGLYFCSGSIPIFSASDLPL